MDMQITKEEKAHILALRGKLDAVTAPAYEHQVTALLEAAPCSLIIDFAGLEYISSAGLRVLLATAKRIKAKGMQLHCANVGGAVQEVFDISGFRSILPVHDGIASALDAIG